MEKLRWIAIVGLAVLAYVLYKKEYGNGTASTQIEPVRQSIGGSYSSYGKVVESHEGAVNQISTISNTSAGPITWGNTPSTKDVLNTALKTSVSLFSERLR